MRYAFTLVELLVVVSVIVVLLALLAPAMDKALYAAEMVKCMANLSATSRAGLVYTADFKRRYPYRSHVIRSQGGSYGAINMNNGTGPNDDDRIIFRNYLDVNAALNCPLNKKLDYVASKTGPGAVNPNTLCYSDYAMWMGWQVGGEKGMFKLGDRFTWRDPRAPASTARLLSSNALVSSFAMCWAGGVPAYADHPDNNGLWLERADENGGDWWNATPLYTITWSTFLPEGHPYKFNMNFALDDNSVRRIDNITPDSYEDAGVQWTRAWTNPAQGNFTPLPAN